MGKFYCFLKVRFNWPTSFKKRTETFGEKCNVLNFSVLFLAKSDGMRMRDFFVRACVFFSHAFFFLSLLFIYFFLSIFLIYIFLSLYWIAFTLILKGIKAKFLQANFLPSTILLFQMFSKFPIFLPLLLKRIIFCIPRIFFLLDVLWAHFTPAGGTEKKKVIFPSRFFFLRFLCRKKIFFSIPNSLKLFLAA